MTENKEITLDDYKKVLEWGQEELKEYMEDGSEVYLPPEVIAAGVEGKSTEDVQEKLDELVDRGEVEKAEVLRNPVKVSDEEYGMSGPFLHLQLHPKDFFKTTIGYRLAED